MRNREAVVEALLDLYREGNLSPNAEEIAARSGLSPRSLFRYFDDVDDLIRAAIHRQQAQALPLVLIDATPESPFQARVAALVDQRFRLYRRGGQRRHRGPVAGTVRAGAGRHVASQSGVPPFADGQPVRAGAGGDGRVRRRAGRGGRRDLVRIRADSSSTTRDSPRPRPKR